jgi:hypothetical protein
MRTRTGKKKGEKRKRKMVNTTKPYPTSYFSYIELAAMPLFIGPVKEMSRLSE